MIRTALSEIRQDVSRDAHSVAKIAGSILRDISGLLTKSVLVWHRDADTTPTGVWFDVFRPVSVFVVHENGKLFEATLHLFVFLRHIKEDFSDSCWQGVLALGYRQNGLIVELCPANTIIYVWIGLVFIDFGTSNVSWRHEWKKRS